MPIDDLSLIRAMVISALIMSLVAGPLALISGLIARAQGERIVPRWSFQSQTFTGFDILLLFLMQVVFTVGAMSLLLSMGFYNWVYGSDFIPPRGPAPPAIAFQAVGGCAAGEEISRGMIADRTRCGLWASALAIPMLFGLSWVIRVLSLRPPLDPRWPKMPARIALGAASWFVITPIVFTIHFGASWFCELLSLEVQQHPLSRIRVGATSIDDILFGFVVTFLTPLVEEFLYRGLLLRWVVARRFYPWLLILASAVVGVLRYDGDILVPIVFVGVLTLGLIGVYGLIRPSYQRTAMAIWTTSMLFAAAHMPVWPSPIPLFALALGLGYLAARTGGITAPVVVHGLFNAVSFVYLLRGGS